MPNDLPSFLSADVRLGSTLDTLAEVIGKLELEQKKLDTIGNRIVALARDRSAGWDARARSDLASLSARLNMQRKTLDQTRAAFSGARDALEINGKAHDLALEQYRERELARYGAMQVMTRRQGALARILNGMIDGRRREAGMPDPKSEAYVLMTGAYDYIPIDINRLIDMLGRLDTLLSLDPGYSDPERRYRPVAFVEAGAGPGRNMMLVKASELLLTASVSGFDLNGLQVENGRRAFRLEDTLFVADALTFDYSPYDVIFSYRLFRDNDMQAQLETHMVASMKPGAYLLAPFPYDLTLQPDLEVVAPDFDIWKKRADPQMP